MLEFREMSPEDREIVWPMVQGFYHSDAVLHPVDEAVMERTFQDAVNPGEPLLRGVLICADGEPAGYLYLALGYSAEVGGRCIFLEEIFFRPELRGRGLGKAALKWLREQYPDARRLRLEVNRENAGAARLYEKTGYQKLDYDQMVLDLLP